MLYTIYWMENGRRQEYWGGFSLREAKRIVKSDEKEGRHCFIEPMKEDEQ